MMPEMKQQQADYIFTAGYLLTDGSQQNIIENGGIAVKEDTIVATGEIVSAEDNKGGVKVVIRITISVEDAERPACIVDTISIFYP